jgi:hypothetical protein
MDDDSIVGSMMCEECGQVFEMRESSGNNEFTEGLEEHLVAHRDQRLPLGLVPDPDTNL